MKDIDFDKPVKIPSIGKCWAYIQKRTNDARRGHSYAFFWEGCGNNARKGCLTCAKHADREGRATSMKEKS